MPETAKKILIIEDDLATVDALAFKLNQRGILASTALNGEEAIERIKREHYDMILVDLLLPKKNGFEVIQEIRKDDSQSKEALVIVFSNLNQDDNVKKAVSLGADSYLVKADTSISELADMIIKKLSEMQ